MGSILVHLLEVLIALIILNSQLQLHANSQSFSPILTASRFRTSLTTNSSTPIFHWSSSTPTSPFRTPTSSGISPNNRTNSISTRIQNGNSFPEITPTPTIFQSSATSRPTTTIQSQSSLNASSTTPFFNVPNVILNVPIYLDTSVPPSSTSSAPVIHVTNPSDPNQVVSFKTLQIPESQREDLPTVSNTDPAALLLPSFDFPVLLFPSFEIVFPDISSPLPAWLSMSLYPSIFKFITSPMSNQNQPSLSTQTTSTTSTSSSSSPSGTVGDWFISTKTGTTQDQFEVLLSFLAEQNITPSVVQSNWTLSFQQFVATVNSSMVSQIEQYPIVDVVIKNFIITDPLVSGEATFSNLNNSTTLSRRENNEGTREQISAFAPQRAWLSRITQQITEDYIFDSIGGANSFVYVIDTGFNEDHPDFNGQKIETHILPGLTRLPGKAEIPLSIDDDTGHGTCIASIASSNIGIMTKGTLVVAKVNSRTWDPTIIDILQVFAWAVDHIAYYNRAGKSVINFSWAIPPQETDHEGSLKGQWNKLLDDADAKGIVVVVESGSMPLEFSGTPQAIDTYPALLGSGRSLIVVGSHDGDGEASAFSKTGDALTLSALGSGLCASKSGSDYEYETYTGVTYAAPVVAGLVGYLMSLPSVRSELSLDEARHTKDWAGYMKEKVVRLAGEYSFGSRLLIANNGAGGISCNQPATRKRDNSTGGLLPQTTLELDACTPQETTSSQGPSFLSSIATSRPSSSTPLSSNISTQTTSNPVPASSISCQQLRPSGAPLGDQLQSGLTANNAIQTICQASFTSQNSTLTTTFNNAYYYISITRKTVNQTLEWCTSGLNAIITSCILNQPFFGGVYTKDHELYNISNSGYPRNKDPLQIPLPKTTSLTSVASWPASSNSPSHTTVTTNNMECVLIQGSNNSTCTPQSTKFQQSNPTSTLKAYPPWPSTTGPAGFHIIRYSSGEAVYFGNFSLGVVGSANDNCQTILNYPDEYGADGILGDGSDGGMPMYPNFVNSSTNQFYLQQKDSPGLPLCNVTSPKDFRLSFFNTWATNGPGSFSFRDSSGTTGTCIINNNQSTESCQDIAGLELARVTDLMFCEADGNPSYCADH